MASLIDVLATGIPTAPSGTAEFYAAGTETPATVYTLDTTTGELTAIGTTVTLDSEGSKICYAKESVDVIVRTVGGTQKRDRFRHNVHAKAVDVESVAFTGTDEDGDQAAGGVVDLNTVLGRWRASAGTVDFKVRRTEGTADETLIAAFTAVRAANKPFFNVVDYGAVGDDTTDCAPALSLAYAAAVAAGGGIIYWPAASNYYLCNAVFACTNPRISFLGAGGYASRIRWPGIAGAGWTITGGVTDPTGMFIRDLGFIGGGFGGLQINSHPGFLLDNLVLYSCGSLANNNAWIDLQTRTTLRNITNLASFGGVGAGGSIVSFNTGSDYSRIIGGHLQLAQAGTFPCVQVLAPYVTVDGVHMDGSGSSLSAAATNRGLLQLGSTAATGNPNEATIVNCSFQRFNQANPCVAINVDCNFYEANNRANSYRSDIGVFAQSLGAAYTKTASRVSRINRAVAATSTNYTPDPDYQTHLLECGGGFTINGPATSTRQWFPGSAARLTFIIHNTTGGAITQTWNAVYVMSGAASTANLNAGARWRGDFEWDQVNEVWRLIGYSIN